MKIDMRHTQKIIKERATISLFSNKILEYGVLNMIRQYIILFVFGLVIFICNCEDNSLINPFVTNDSLYIEDVRIASIDKNNHKYLKIYNIFASDIESVRTAYLKAGIPFFTETAVFWNLDENLIPVVPYEFGDYYNPVTTTHTALGFYRDYMNFGGEEDRLGFLNNAEWLINQSDSNWYLLYKFPFKHAHHEMPGTGWVSSMAQGGALAVMCRAYLFTDDDRYLNAAKGFFQTLYRNGDSFWCIVVDENGYYWHEEYPNEDFCHVLNGMLYSLWGLWDYYVLFNDSFALTLFLAGVRSIADNYPIWNVEGVNGSRYCLHYKDTTGVYHPLHIALLELYLKWFEIPEFRDAINLFTSE